MMPKGGWSANFERSIWFENISLLITTWILWSSREISNNCCCETQWNPINTNKYYRWYQSKSKIILVFNNCGKMWTKNKKQSLGRHGTHCGFLHRRGGCALVTRCWGTDLRPGGTEQNGLACVHMGWGVNGNRYIASQRLNDIDIYWCENYKNMSKK